MTVSSERFRDVLVSLMPQGPEDVSCLRWAIYFAHRMQKGVWQEPVEMPGNPALLLDAQAPKSAPDVVSFIKALPEDCRKYFHGLVEALDIYKEIHGKDVPTDESALQGSTIHELRLIRDMCLETNLHCLY